MTAWAWFGVVVLGSAVLPLAQATVRDVSAGKWHLARADAALWLAVAVLLALLLEELLPAR
jgi:hypothetical protein